MPHFRPRLAISAAAAAPPAAPAAAPTDLLAVGQLIDELMQPGHFFVAPDLHLRWTEPRAEDVPWEVFRGRLLDPAQTRRQARLLSWHVVEEGGTPLLSARLDVHAGAVHVTRGIRCYVWEPYDAGGNVIESREIRRWTTELVGSADLDRFTDLEELRDELICLIWQAIVGTSRLPLHSVEAPLPQFTFGQLHYVHRPQEKDVGSPGTTWRCLLAPIRSPALSRRERAKALEALLRHVGAGNLRAPAEALREDAPDVLRLLRTTFNDVSLSPYTDFVHNTLAFLPSIEPRPIERANLLAHLLRQLTRHLTAYDLVNFHHAGANFPDALMLDEVLRDYLDLARQHAYLFVHDGSQFRLRRRALRQACLLRRRYEGHAVPDAPTSPGEYARVLPPSHPRIPEEQMLQPHRRQRRLFAGEPLHGLLDEPGLRRLVAQSIRDLETPAERAELGVGLFIDRPLGYGKRPGEPDLTPILAHEAFSPSLARRRWHELESLAAELSLELPADLRECVLKDFEIDPIRGLPADRLAEPLRPATSLADVRRVADDFVIVRTLPGGLRDFLACFDFHPVQARADLPFLREGQTPRVVAIVQLPRGPILAFLDDDYRCRLEVVADVRAGYVRRAGIELPAGGLLVRVAGTAEDIAIPRRR